MAKQKPTKVPVSRVRQMADSLQKRAVADFHWANATEKLAKKEKNTTVKNILSQHAEQTWRDFNHNYGKADRYRASADKAVAAAKAKASAGRDTPLPSSDGIIGTITNKISELFK